MSRIIRYICWCIPLFMWQCKTEDESQALLMKLMDANVTGVHFQNKITPNEEVNLLNYEYMYNGGGVGVGDFDIDGLPDLVFTGNMVESKIFLNKGNFRFEDISNYSGFDTKGKWCTGVSVIDINNDGLDDIYLSVGGPGKKSIFPNLLYVNQDDQTFAELANEYGLDDPNESIQSVFFDYDLDGDLDMYLLNGGGFEKSAVTVRSIRKDGSSRNTDALYQNNFSEDLKHAVFTDVSAEAGITIEGFGLGVGIIDANKDGWPDIYVSNDYLSKDLLYINNQDGSFSEEAELYFNHMSHFSMGNDIGDINNDGRLDIITLDMLPEDHYRRKMMFGPNHYDRFYQAVDYGYGFQYMRNMLHLDNGKQGYTEIGQMAGIDRTDWSWCPLIADFDNDGYQDIYITNGFGKDITDLDFVKFRKDAIKPFSDPGEVKNLLIKNLENQPSITLPNYIYKNNGNYTFTKTVKDWGISQPSISNGAVYVDLDQDGDLEIVTNNIDRDAFIYKNMSRERDSISAHFLNVQLRGNPDNKDGIGAIVNLFLGENVQLRHQQKVRGFQSCVSNIIHFGLNHQSIIDSLLVSWPDGKCNTLHNVRADQTLSIHYSEAKLVNPSFKTKASLLRHSHFVNYQHLESGYSDFKQQPLLIHGFAQQGPGMAVGDVNGDQLDDVFIGGSYGTHASLFIQTIGEKFFEKIIPTKIYEDLGALFFDADQDQDLDLYVVSGGSERYREHPYYQDRIYINDGNGNFIPEESILPPMLTSTTAVAGGDYDQDGDIDLFIGGRVVPGAYPSTPLSYILENTQGKFEEVTEKVNPDLKNLGMVTAAIWTDFNNDHLQDLIVVGEMMKISVFRNDGDTLVEISDDAGLQYSSGMWNSIASGDFDNDGDMDYIVGNVGLNTSFKVSMEHPMELHFADYDQNGSIDPIFSIFEEGQYYPMASLDLMTQQLPELKKKVLHYKSYAESTTADILNILDNSSQETLYCENQLSVLVENLGNGRFSMRSLPLMAQVAPIKGILIEDLDLDGLIDMVLVGNEYNTEVVSGKYDAFNGVILLNEGNLSFKALQSAESGLYISGDARSIVKLELGQNNTLLLIGQNNGSVENYILSKMEDAIQLSFAPDEVSATLKYSDGKTRMLEYNLGSGYLSQHTRKFYLSSNIEGVYFNNTMGQQTRYLDLYEQRKNS